MARFDNCEICDYNEEKGSFLDNSPPHSKGRVRLTLSGRLCQDCYYSVVEALESYNPEDFYVTCPRTRTEEVSLNDIEEPSTMPLWDEF